MRRWPIERNSDEHWDIDIDIGILILILGYYDIDTGILGYWDIDIDLDMRRWPMEKNSDNPFFVFCFTLPELPLEN